MEIPEVAISGIKSRSKWLAKEFPHLQYDDLKQDGILHVLLLLEKSPSAPIDFIMKSINNKYSTTMRDAIAYKKRFIQLESLAELENGSVAVDPGLDEKIDAEKMRKELSNQDDSLIYQLINKGGMSHKEIKKLLGKPRSSMYRKFKRIERIRNAQIKK